MKNYFIVKTKCGHVGRNMYVPIDFAIWAENAREAAVIARQRPGVKRNHPDAILSVTEITREEYFLAKQTLIKDLYWQKESMGTKTNQAIFLSLLEPETSHHAVHKLAIRQHCFEKNNKIASRQFRYRKANCYDRLVKNDILREYGVSL